MPSRPLLSLFALLAATAASNATAADIAFSGAMVGSAIVAPNAGCAPIPFQGIISAGAGTSSFGNFNYSHTVCTSGQAGGPVVGNYTIDFGPDQFFGALTGNAQPNPAVPGTSNLALAYTILGGTGRFLGGTGAFNALGTADPRVRPSIVSLNFTAVPEPTTWAMMLLGFGVIGASLRRRRAAALLQVA